MTTFLAILAALVLVFALGAVIAARTEDRDRHRSNAEHLAAELAAAYEALNSVLDEHALCPAPVRHLSVVPPLRSDSWLEQVMDEQAALGDSPVHDDLACEWLRAEIDAWDGGA